MLGLRTHSNYGGGYYKWFLFKENSKSGDPIVSISIYWGCRLTGIWINYTDEGKWSLNIGLYFIYLSISVKPPSAKYRGYGTEKQISLTFHDGAMWWRIWTDPNSWSKDTPKWRNGNFNPMNVIFGRDKCTTIVKETKDILVPMPEKSYPATAKLIEYCWKRQRWPFSKKMLRVEIDIPNGIPFEGKCENSWDCGTDATYTITTGECHSIAEGVGKLVGSVLRSRVKNGGWSDWEWKKEDKK